VSQCSASIFVVKIAHLRQAAERCKTLESGLEKKELDMNKEMTEKKVFKKIIIVFIIALLINSCNAYKSITDSTYPGMTKKEFMQEVKYPTIEIAHEGVEVYKKNKRLVRGGVVVFETHFFYFKKGELIRIDTGERVNPRQVIDLNINNN
jgi:amino acid permease